MNISRPSSPTELYAEPEGWKYFSLRDPTQALFLLTRHPEMRETLREEESDRFMGSWLKAPMDEERLGFFRELFRLMTSVDTPKGEYNPYPCIAEFTTTFARRRTFDELASLPWATVTEECQRHMVSQYNLGYFFGRDELRLALLQHRLTVETIQATAPERLRAGTGVCPDFTLHQLALMLNKPEIARAIEARASL